MKIEILNLSFSYAKGVQVLLNISLTIVDSGFVVFTGPSGCGKSTLLRLLIGAPSILAAGQVSGSIFIDSENPNEAVAKRKISYMSQEDSLFPNLTLLENLKLPFMFMNKDVPSNFDELVDFGGLKKYLSLYPHELSGGTRKRGELIRAFLTSPSLVVLDEPFSKQDVKHKNSLYENLLKLRELNNTLVFMVTHDLLEAVLLSNIIYVMNSKGEIVRKLTIEKPIPRILSPEGIRLVEDEFVEIKSLILSEPSFS